VPWQPNDSDDRELARGGRDRIAGRGGRGTRLAVRTRLGPISLPPHRVRLWAVAVAVIGLVPIDTAYVNGGGDFQAFWAAGATVGTADLVDGARHAACRRLTAWRSTTGDIRPAWPTRSCRSPIFRCGSVCGSDDLMLALVAWPGWLLARIFELSPSVTVLLAFCMGPGIRLDRHRSERPARPCPGALGNRCPAARPRSGGRVGRRPSHVQAHARSVPSGPSPAPLPVACPRSCLLCLRGLVPAERCRFGRRLALARGVVDGMQPWLAPDFIHNAEQGNQPAGTARPAPGRAALVARRVRCGGHPGGASRSRPRSDRRSRLRRCLLTNGCRAARVGYEAGLMLPILAWSIAGGLSERGGRGSSSSSYRWPVVARLPLHRGQRVALVVAAATAMWLWRWRPLGPNPLVAAAD